MDSDLKDSLRSLVGVAENVVEQSDVVSAALEGSRRALTAFTQS